MSFNFIAAVTVRSDCGAKEKKIYHCLQFFPFYLPWSDGTGCMIIDFWMWVLSQLFHSPLSPSSRSSLVPLHFLALEWYHLHIWSERKWKWSCLIMSDSLWPHYCSTPGFPVHHQLPELTQTHNHWVSDAIQPSHPLSSPSPPAFTLSQHQGLFKWVGFFASGGQSIGVSASVLPMNIQDWSPLG